MVEDEWLIRETLAEVLAQAWFRILEASKAKQPLRYCRSTDRLLTCFLTDIRMPGKLDGLELARRARELLPDLPILVASGNWVPRLDDLPTGSLFLAKPYSFRELPGQLRTFLEKG